MTYSDMNHTEAGRILLKKALAEYGIRDYEIKYGEYGKPYTDGIHFSISHSGRLAAVMLSSCECGIDVQEIRSVSEKTIQRVCNGRELEKINGASDKMLCFCKIWAAKESHVKMTGEGMRGDFKNIPYSVRIMRIGEYITAISPKQRQSIKWVRI